MGLLDDLTNLMGASTNTEQDKKEAAAEAAKLDLNGLKDLIAKVTAMLAGKNNELAGLQEKLKGLSPMDLLGDKGGDLKDQVAKLLSVVSSLKTKLAVYEEAAKDKQA
ncbi:MAG: hypothetical protein J5654_04760 [Victivallales bacterium]|nr:hypothetical protein [Victivallales bacterium]